MKYSFVRFVMVGVVNTLVGLSVMYLLLNGLGLSYWLSTFIGNSVGACVSFLLNRRFTFRSDGSVLNGFIRFVAVILICYFLSYSIGKNLVPWLLSDYGSITSKVKTNLAVLFSTFLYTILNYFGQKLFVFPQKEGNVLKEENH